MASHLRSELGRLIATASAVSMTLLVGAGMAAASQAKVYAGGATDVAIVVDGEKCTERITYDGQKLTYSLLRASGRKSAFWVNTDASGDLHWARPGKNSTYEELDDQGYLVTYILNSAGELVGPPRLFDVDWRDSTLVTGKELAVAYSLSGERVFLRG